MNRPGTISERRKPQEVTRFIQHTFIETGSTRGQIIEHCKECVTYGFNAAMVPGSWVSLACDVLRGTGIMVVSAVDFPLGVMSTAGKVAEAKSLVQAGAQQLDIGVHTDWLRSGMYDEYRADIVAVVEAVKPLPVKVMLELPLLTPKERDEAVRLSVEAGVAYVKNASSGAVGIATPEEMRYLRNRVPPHVKVKASGGIKTFEQISALLDAGADLIGTSAGVSIVKGIKHVTSEY